MEIWAYIGMAIMALFGGFLVMWITYQLLKLAKVSVDTAGLWIVVMSCAYVSYVTWAITSNNVPFLNG
jgi:hypothetical protein